MGSLIIIIIAILAILAIFDFIEKRNKKAELDRFNIWLKINLEFLKSETIKNSAIGQNLITNFENGLVETSINEPVNFLKLYYEICNDQKEIGTLPLAVYKFKYSHYEVQSIYKDLFEYNGKELSIKGIRKKRSEIIKLLNPKLKEQILKSALNVNFGKIFLDGILDLDDFKTNIRSRYQTFYRSGAYYKYGPFSWLRNEKILNPSNIRRTLNDNKVKKLPIKTISHYFKEGKLIKRDFILPMNINNNQNESYTAETLNAHITKNKFSTSSKQPFVNKSFETNTITTTKHHPSPQKALLHEAITQTKINISNKKENSINSPIRENEFILSSTSSESIKHRQSKTKIYILITPFSANGNVEIKIGESTNIKARIDDYRQYWRDKFCVLTALNGIVEDETIIKNILSNFHTSNEFYTLNNELIQIISKSKTIETLKKELKLKTENYDV